MLRTPPVGVLVVLVGLAAAQLFSGCRPAGGEANRLVRDGNAYFAAAEYGRAEEAFTRALALEPGKPGILVNRANARMMAGDLAGAREDYAAALAADPTFATAYANRGILRDREGDAAGAAADYRRALELDPSLGRGPGILDRILYNRPTGRTIKDRLEFLEATGKAGAPRGKEEQRH